MINLSLEERFETIINIISETKGLSLIFPVIIIFAIILFLLSKVNNKKINFLYALVYFLIGVGIYIKYNSEVLSLLDYYMTNVVEKVLFPNLATFSLMIVIINIIVCISAFSSKQKRYIKNINIIMFSIMQVFIYLIAKNIFINDLDVYNELVIYQNQNLLVLIEMCMIIFILWMTLLSVIRLTNAIAYEEVVETKEVKVDNKVVVTNDEINETGYNPNKLILSYITEPTNELVEYVPIKKKVAQK